MTTTATPPPAPGAEVDRLEVVWHQPAGLRRWFTTVDHKSIGTRYLITAAIFFVIAGLEALAIRTQLVAPEAGLIGPDLYNQLFSMHGITMIFLFVTPMLAGFGNYVVPLQIGARDMAFPRLNAFSYWVFAASGIFMYSGFLIGEVPNDGWFNYVPLALEEYTPGKAIDYYGLGLIFLAISTTAGAINFIVTIFKLRAPGMSINRMPLFCWAILVTSFAIVFALPSLTAANLMLELERLFGFHFFAIEHGGDPVLWQHLFWIFGHPDVYIIFLPAVGIVSSVIPVFSRRRIVGYTWLAFSTVATGFIGFGVWVHHMFAVGLPQISMGFYAAASLMITIPSGIQVFAWIATLLTGRVVLKTPMLFALGFLVVFVMGGVTGVMFAMVPFDQQITDSYFVVAHFHYVLFGGAVFPIFAGIHYWLPKIAGRMYDKRLGVASFWLIFVGFNLTFFPMHVAGLLGMPRRVYTYPGDLGWTWHQTLATVGAYVLAIGILVVIVNVVRAVRSGPLAPDDPWGADTLEWFASSPPREYNFPVVPTVRSAHPNWDREDREADLRRAREGELVLAKGHQGMASTVMEGEAYEVVRFPEGSWMPFLTTLALLLFFFAALDRHWWVATGALGLAVLALALWHRSTGTVERSE